MTGEQKEMRRLLNSALIQLVILALYVIFILVTKWYAGFFMIPAWLIFPLRALRQYRVWQREQKDNDTTK